MIYEGHRKGSEKKFPLGINWPLNCYEAVLGYMRIETKARRGGSIGEQVAQGGSGVAGSTLLVRLFGDRQPAERIFDQFRSPISLLNFEPFRSTMRPNGLRVIQQPTPQGESETKRQQKTYLQEPVANRSLATNAEGPGR